MRRTALLALVLAIGLVLAGCGGGGGTTTTAPEDEPTTVPDGGTTTAGDATTTDTESSRSDAARVKDDAMTWMQDVESYRVDATIERRTVSGGVSRNTTTNYTTRIDVADRRLAAEYVRSAMGQTVRQELYIVDRTLYVHSEQFARQYGSEWIEQSIDERFDERWQAYDTVAAHRQLLNVSTVSVVDEASVDGTSASVLRFEPDLQALEDVRTQSYNTSNVNELRGKVWIAKDDGRLLKSFIHVNATATVRGTEYTSIQELTRRFSGYDEPVEVTLPEDAETAVEVGNQTTGSS